MLGGMRNRIYISEISVEIYHRDDTGELVLHGLRF